MGEATGSNNGSPALNSFVALGDSFTEGLDDPGHNGAYRGWADRLADSLARNQPGLRYANLAVRGKLLHQIIADQVPAACALRADLVSLSAGGNDLIRPGGDPDALAELFDGAVRRLRDSGATVLISTGFDTRETPVLRRIRGKVGTYNSHLRAIADRHDCPVMDLWAMRTLRDSRAWSGDRLHLSPDGHQLVALCAQEALGLPTEQDWRRPWPPRVEQPWHLKRGEDLAWAREYLVPWIGRRLRGRSSGDGRGPKRPELHPVHAPSAR